MKLLESSGIIGIQGGAGSYNDLAIRKYLSDAYDPTRIVFLDSTPNVFKSLNKKEIKYGQFAAFNSWTGFYRESLDEIARNRFSIVDFYSIPVNHAFMIHMDQDVTRIERILTHREVIKQCKKTVAERYGNLPLDFTSGELIDPSAVGSKIAKDPEFQKTALIGNPVLAKIHGLKIVDPNLSDMSESRSTFLLVCDFQ